MTHLLTAERLAAGLTQRQLANAAGIDASVVCRTESGERHPTRETMIFLADALALTGYRRYMLLSQYGYVDQASDPLAWMGSS